LYSARRYGFKLKWNLVVFLQGPTAVFSDGSHLFVADGYANRVLIWNTIPTIRDSRRPRIGPTRFTSSAINNGGVTGSSMNFPTSIYSDGVRLFVADWQNQRVLAWNSLPTTNGQAADFVLGQPTLNANTANNPTISASALDYPAAVTGDGKRLIIGDSGNNRVLIWDSLPTNVGPTRRSRSWAS